MNQREFFACVIDVLDRLEIPYMVSGSVASIAYGEPRMTLDMDVVVELTEEKAKELASSFADEFYVSLPSMLAAIQHQSSFNIIHSRSGSKVDFYVLKGDPFSRKEFSRRRKEAFDDAREAIFASPEDVILHKLVFHKEGRSEKHIRDIQGVLEISGNKLDLVYIEKWVRELGLEDGWKQCKGE